MIRVVILTIIVLMVISCSKDNDSLMLTELDNPSVMIVFCQSSMNDIFRLVEYEYDDEKLITETLFQNDEIQSKTTYGYNSDNQLISEVYLANRIKTEKTYVYNGNKQLINTLYNLISYDSNGQIANETKIKAPREYENNRLVKEWEFWGGFNTYEYSGDKVVKKIDYTKNGEKHHITTYKYSGDLLIEEIKENKVGGLIYLKTYMYDSQNRLIKIKDGENSIEENDYIDNKLIERRAYYFGIDPCFAPCCGNFVYRFEY